MSRFVIDSSVVMKWYVPEVHSADALRYLAPSFERHAPELLLAELANILWKKIERGELTRDEGMRIANDVRQMAVTLHSMEAFIEPALSWACTAKRTAYDCMYLALADALSARLVTADRRLYNALKGTSAERLVLWIEDNP